ncbi:zinc finger BED domain-containing protein RICESLEEPER 1-like [Ipomoea triloba]|uniref:zinc finger BED domain-containing protein RICESLEEPER 1-like n=1 Tax=Ipomoea triloba TaxID=35885 RepID=UPI00125DAA30|nr:zinc finger BED domain-containing protein RICESLEEPER 1-like [Ipomoea triloba]
MGCKWQAEMGHVLHRKIISFKPISDHKGETIAKELENCLIDWGIKKDGLATMGNSVVSVRNAVKWNSTYLMLSAAFKNKAAFDRMIDEDKLYDSYFQEDENGKRRVGPPLSDDWENVRRLVQFLKIFYDATLAFSSYKNVTSSHCFNDICTIEANLNVFTSSRDVNMSNMAFEMKKKFDKYWEGLEINKLLIISSVLDPRSKMGFVTICFEKLYGKDTPKCIEMKEAIMEVLRKLYEVYNALYAKPSATTNQSTIGCGSGSGSESGSQSCETSEMELLDVGVNVDMVCEKGDVDETSNELDIYLMEKIEKPTLNRLVSSVASGCAFSTPGRILDQYRSSLTPYMVEALILTQDGLLSSLQSDATVNLFQILEETEFMDLLAEAN